MDRAIFNRRLGNIMRRQRVLRGLSQKQVGVVIGVTFQQVQKYERGQNSLSAGHLPKLAALLGIEILDVIYEMAKGNMPTEPVMDDRAEKATLHFNKLPAAQKDVMIGVLQLMAKQVRKGRVA